MYNDKAKLVVPSKKECAISFFNFLWLLCLEKPVKALVMPAVFSLHLNLNLTLNFTVSPD